MGKAALWRVPADHFGTLYDNRNKRPDWGGLVAQVGVPVLAGLGTWHMGAKLTDVSGAVAGVSVVAALLFPMAIFLFQLRVDLPDDERLGDDDYALVDECMSNTLWASLWGLTLALFLIVTSAGKWISADGPGPVLMGIAVAAATHFVFVIAMCLKRLRRAYERIAMKRS
ncbi:hypothetical protein [Barrientosiimonas humi]|uniref:hypothetical protein n=1 Tax=Barrientosiimonas humi TaxID=999931 RepID=UPI00370DAC17